MKRVACWAFIVAALWASAALSRSTQIFYVNENSAGGNCSSWSLACPSLDTALSAASVAGSGQIWVAKGTYKPSIQYGGGYSGTQANLVTFNLPKNTAIYGGFKGTETSLSQRNPQQNVTILSGDINGDDVNSPGNYTNKSDNAWHVLTADNGVTNVSIDGFTVQGGYAGGPDAGVASKEFFGSQIESITYAHTAGGALTVRNGSQVSANNIQFLYNYADSTNATLMAFNAPIVPLIAGGGAISVMEQGSSASVTGSSFTNNAAIHSGNAGGSLKALFGASVSVSGCNILNSQADHVGGGIYARQGASISVSGSNLNNNQTTGTTGQTESGGAIGALNANISVTGSNFNNNSAAEDGGGGGAIFFHIPLNDGFAYHLTITGSTFTGNTASLTGGGAIFALAAVPGTGTTSSISSSNFYNNQAGIGGAILIDSIPMTLQGSIFNNNTAFVQGGAIFSGNFGAAIFDITNKTARSLLSITGSIFTNNSITIPSLAPTLIFIYDSLAFGISLGFGQQQASVDAMPAGGGALAVEFGGNVAVQSSIFSNNSASSSGVGGAILVGGNHGKSGTTAAGMNQAYLSIQSSLGAGNTPDNKDVLDPAGLGSNPNGVEFVTDGSFN